MAGEENQGFILFASNLYEHESNSQTSQLKSSR